MSRRGNGEGTVYKRKDGRWEGAAYVLTANGGRVRRRVYGRTRAEVSEKLTALQRNSHQGLPAAVTNQTMAEYLESWLRDAAAVKVRPTTLHMYSQYVRRHIVPVIGKKKVTG